MQTNRKNSRRFELRHRQIAIAAAAFSSILVGARLSPGQTWNNPNSGNWSVGGNWVGGSPPASASTTALLFNATASQAYTATQNLGNPFTLNAITFNPASTGTINLAGSMISFAGTNPAITPSGSGTVTIANPLRFAANTTIGGSGSGTIISSAALSSSVTATGTAGAMFSSAFPGTLVLSGGGTLYALRANSAATNIVGGTYTLTSTQLGNDVFLGTNDGGFPSLTVGGAGLSASINISGGASLSVQNAFAGNESSSNGTLSLSGSTTRLTAASRIGVNYGSGTISITNGAIATAQFVELGHQAGATANLLVDGTGSALNCTSDFSAPLTGTSAATVRITSGGAINVGGNANLGFATSPFGAILSSTGTLTISGSGSQFNVNGDGQESGVLIAGIGDAGVSAAASVSISSAASMHVGGAILGRADGAASIAISGAGSTFTNDGELDLNGASSSTIAISSAGAWTNSGNVFTSSGSSDQSQITISGTNSLADFSNAQQVVFSGGGGANVAGGSSMISISTAGEMRANLISVADAQSSRAGISIDGANSKLTLQSALGDNSLILANAAGSIGTINITNGGVLSVAPTAGAPGKIFLATALASGSLSAAQATVSISGANSALTTGAAGTKLYVGGYDNGSGIIDGGIANFSVLSGASADLKQLAYIGSKGTLVVGSGTAPATFKSGSLIVNGTVNFNSGTLQSAGTMSVGGTIRLSSSARNGGGTPTNKKTLESGTLTLTGSGLIDLDDNDALLHNNTESQIRSLVATARSGGAWTGVGITSTAAKNNGAGNTNLAVITGQQYKSVSTHLGTTSFNSLPLNDSDVIVKYTWNGDADLDGRVNGSDYARLDNGFNNHLTGWVNGDFNYDGAINGSDYGMIDFAFTTQASIVLSRGTGDSFAGPVDRAIVLAGVDPQTIASPIDLADRALFLPIDSPTNQAMAVPEPAILGIAGIFAGGLLLRRRRSANI